MHRPCHRSPLGRLCRLTSLTHYAPRDAGETTDTGPFTDNEILGEYVYLLREDGRRIGAIEKHDAGTSTGNSDLIITRWAWSYDSMGRLTQEAYDSPDSGQDFVHTYTFDAAGNRASWLKDTDPAFGSTGTGHLTFDVQSFAAEVTVTYDYDDNDRLLTETLDAPGAADDRHTVSDWDGGGSAMQLGKVAYDTLDDTGDVVREESFMYSARGRMAGAEIDADGAGSSSPEAETTTTYTYDDHGFRIRQSTMHDSTTVVTEFVADANNPTGYTQTIEEHVDGEVLRSYTFGMDEIIQAVKENPTASAVVSQFLHDGRGSVRQLADALAELVQAATKDAAAVLKLDYSAYGTAVNYAAETVATALLHNGEFVDSITGQQYLRARWYDQSSGRFNRVDPFAGEASVPQSLHKYLFAHGDPASLSDASGESPLLLGILIGAIIGAIIGGIYAGHAAETINSTIPAPAPYPRPMQTVYVRPVLVVAPGTSSAHIEERLRRFHNALQEASAYWQHWAAIKLDWSVAGVTVVTSSTSGEFKRERDVDSTFESLDRQHQRLVIMGFESSGLTEGQLGWSHWGWGGLVAQYSEGHTIAHELGHVLMRDRDQMLNPFTWQLGRVINTHHPDPSNVMYEGDRQSGSAAWRQYYLNKEQVRRARLFSINDTSWEY